MLTAAVALILFSFIKNGFVSVFGVDQNNIWQASAHSKRGEFRGAERVNKLGMPIQIRSETVLNVSLPAALGLAWRCAGCC